MLAHALCFLSLVLLACPSAWAADTASNPRGDPLLAVDLSGGCTLDDQGLACEASLGDTRLDLPWLSGRISGQAVMRLEGREMRVQNLALSMDQAALSLSGESTAPIDLTITGTGVYDPDSGSLDLDQAELRLGRALVCRGTLSMGTQGLRADLRAEAADPKALLDLLGPALPPDLQQAALSGPLDLRLALQTTPGDLLDAEITLGLMRPVRLILGPDSGYDLPPLNVTVQVAELAEDQGRTGWALKGGVDVGGKPGGGLLVLADSHLDFDLEYLHHAGGDTTVVRQLAVRPSGESMLPVAGLGLSGSIERPLDGPHAGGWQAEDLRIALGGMPLSGQASMDENATLRASLTSGWQGLDRLAPVLGALTGQDASSWGINGQGRLGLNLVSRNGVSSSDVRLSLAKAGFFDTENGRGGQDLSLDLKLHVAAGNGPAQTRASLDLDKGGLLLGTLFLDFGKNPLTLKASGSLADTRLSGLGLDVDWQGFLALNAKGDASKTDAGWDWNLSGSVERMDLGPVFKTFVADPQSIQAFQGDGAGLSGDLGLAFDLASRSGVIDASGRVTLDQGGLVTADQSLAVEGLALDLPFDYRLGAPAFKTSQEYLSPDQWGSLTMAAIRTPLIELHPGALGAALSGNRFYLKGALELPLLGGMVRLDKVRCDEPLSEDLTLETSVLLTGLDLGELPGPVPIQGHLSGDLGDLVLTREALTVPGSLHGDLFGGELTIWGIYADRPLDPSRQIGLEMVLEGLDLEALSTATDFGRVTGHLDVELRGFSLAYGEPVTMWLMARTPDDDDSDKTVSLKAVNNLSVLGTGSGIGDMGVGMFASFFEEFDYSRIGFLCELDNDRFRLNGLIHEGGTEYLIKKPFLTGINVVNRNPDSTVSFRDMLERVERVMPSESTEGPEIQMN